MKNEITAIEPQKNDPHRFSVFLDGAFAFGIEDMDLHHLGLKPGQVLSDQELDAVKDTLDSTKCRNYAAGLIAKRMYTRQEITKKMELKGYAPGAIQETLQLLTEYGYLDDRNYATLYCQQNMEKYGVHKLRFELRRKGIAGEIINEALGGLDQTAQLKDLIRQRTGDRPLDRKAYEKLVRYLAARGFEYDMIRSCLDQYKEDVTEFE